ncbi:hypothetical protein [Acetobacter senegalensis]
MSRIRKAWRTAVRGYDGEDIVYAATAGKARYKKYLDVSDCNESLTFADIKVRRDKAADIVLPDAPIISAKVSQRALEKLLHACGASRERPEKCGCRDHFYCDAKNEDMAELVNAGLMIGPGKGWEEGYAYFRATSIGQKTALALCPLYHGDDFAWNIRAGEKA